MATMNRSDREELRKVLNGRRRVARSTVEHRKAQLVADMETQLARIYPKDDPRWREITATAEAAVRKADALVAKHCREAGIPEEFRPGLNIYWHGRGENGCEKRRAELRKVGTTQIEAKAREALLAVDTGVQHGLEMLAVDALESEAAQRFMASMPTVESLMPPIEVEALEVPRQSDRDRLLYG